MPKFRIGSREYPSKKAAQEAVRDVLYGYSVGSTVDQEADHLLLLDLLDMHEEADAKIGVGVEAFAIAPPLQGPYPGFEVIRTDGTRIDFSYLACLKPPSYRQQVSSAMRVEVKDDVSAYFTSRVAANTLLSDESGRTLDIADTHVSYYRGPSFAELAAAFAHDVGGWDAIELTTSSDPGRGKFTDRALAERWREYHQEHAVLALLSSQENLRRPRR
ncbi:DCL family protein [Streptomyces sp. NPDC048523]|uniref:DCL family protein n=1 Tax=Streptomyces sp. NPDC048523 TaxID=3365567 RepID=UPI003714DF6B